MLSRLNYIPTRARRPIHLRRLRRRRLYAVSVVWRAETERRKTKKKKGEKKRTKKKEKKKVSREYIRATRSVQVDCERCIARRAILFRGPLKIISLIEIWTRKQWENRFGFYLYFFPFLPRDCEPAENYSSSHRQISNSRAAAVSTCKKLAVVDFSPISSLCWSPPPPPLQCWI